MHTVIPRASEGQRAGWTVKALVPDKWRVSYYSVEPGHFIGNDGEEVLVDELAVRSSLIYQTEDLSVDVYAPNIWVAVSILVKAPGRRLQENSRTTTRVEHRIFWAANCPTHNPPRDRLASVKRPQILLICRDWHV
jgi:hypothetical protein